MAGDLEKLVNTGNDKAQLEDLAELLGGMGDHALEARVRRRIVDIDYEDNQKDQEDDEERWRAKNELAARHYGQSSYAEAEQLYREVLAEVEAAYGQHDDWAFDIKAQVSGGGVYCCGFLRLPVTSCCF